MSETDQSFSKVLGQADTLALAFGAMIGFGWIVLTGEFLDGAGTLGAALAFVLGGGIIGLVGLTYAELVTAMPHSGGEHHYVLRAIGSRGAFVCSWFLVLGYLSVVAFEAVALPRRCWYLAPDMVETALVGGRRLRGLPSWAPSACSPRRDDLPQRTAACALPRSCRSPPCCSCSGWACCCSPGRSSAATPAT